jgi:aspartate/methionine/tyrosine aminotransferase
MKKESKVYDIREIQPAERISRVSEYYFSRKLKEIARMNAEGRNVINLGIGSPDRPPSDAVIRELRSHALSPDEHGYQPYVGIPEFRQAVADWYKRWYDVTLDPHTEIQPLIGSKEGILHISMAFLNPGDGVLIPNPGYPTYSSVSKLVGADIKTYDLTEENYWEPDFACMEKMDLSNVKLMWVNYPNMPTGAPASISLFERIVEFGMKHGILIAHDNPYSFILNDEPLSIMQIPDAKDVCIELNSFSKSHNMPGWRMAMLVSNAQFVEWVLRVKSNVDSGQFKPMQYAAVKALKSGKGWHTTMNRLYHSRRVLAERIMNTLGCKYDNRQTGLFLWGRIPDDVFDSEVLVDHILQDANVFITPGSIFGSQGERYIRISLCCKNDVMAEALNRIRSCRI